MLLQFSRLCRAVHYLGVFCFFVGVVHEAEAAENRLIVDPAPAGVSQNDDFAVKVRNPGGDWQKLSTYLVKVAHNKMSDRTVENASMATFDFEGSVEVAVTSSRQPIQSVKIRPLSYEIKPRIEGNTIIFSLSRPCNLSVEINDDIFHNLHLFANPLEESRPNLSDPNVIYFGPGVHDIPDHQLRVPSGKTVYMAGGAVICGQILIDHAHDVQVLGRGMTDQRSISITNSSHVKISGIFASQIFIGGSSHVEFSNIKCISYQRWGDGIDVICSSDVRMDGLFNRNSDDCIAIYAKRGSFSGGSRDITLRNASLWADVAHPILVGTHGNTKNPEKIENLRFLNLDILDQMEPQLEYQGCMSLNASDSNLIRDVRFEDVRVEDFRLGQLVNVRVCFNRRYCTSPGRGIEDVCFKNISYTGTHANASIIEGYDDQRKVKDIVFENLSINGVKISDHMDKLPWYKTSDMANFFVGEHVEGIRFR